MADTSEKQQLRGLMVEALKSLQLSLDAELDATARLQAQLRAFELLNKSVRMLDGHAPTVSPAPVTRVDSVKNEVSQLLGEISRELGSSVPRSHATSPRRVLYLDDNPASQELVMHILSLHGHRVQAVGRADDAYLTIRQRPFDVLLVDIDLPHREAPDLIQSLRGGTSPEVARMPIVAITSGSTSNAHYRMLLRQVDAFISRPFDAHDLVACVEKCAPVGVGR